MFRMIFTTKESTFNMPDKIDVCGCIADCDHFKSLYPFAMCKKNIFFTMSKSALFLASILVHVALNAIELC